MKLKEGTKIYPEVFCFKNINNILKGNPLTVLPKAPKGYWWNFDLDCNTELYFVLCKIEGFKKTKKKKKK